MMAGICSRYGSERKMIIMEFVQCMASRRNSIAHIWKHDILEDQINKEAKSSVARASTTNSGSTFFNLHEL
jgi:hypothetical protein